MSRTPRIAGPCPYLAGAPPWRIVDLQAPSLESGRYESMLAEGWRRSGPSFYRPVCDGCSLCVPIRVDVRRFSPSASQRRAARRNRDLAIAATPLGFSQERLALYEDYLRIRHGHEPVADAAESRRQYEAFLLSDPLDSGLAMDYRLGEGGRLLATGYLDVLPDGLSSVYFAWDPSEARRSLGVHSVLAEIAYAASLGKRWYYLGFWVPGSPSMDYKADFGPAELAIGGRWLPLDPGLRAKLEAGSPE